MKVVWLYHSSVNIERGLRKKVDPFSAILSMWYSAPRRPPHVGRQEEVVSANCHPTTIGTQEHRGSWLIDLSAQ
ncbi:hypothetical protein LshimejAT787_0411340 [Lyophyllum shimeji]|uniref:Uncharacterized protein n=1 Tax=Lyophyllum shimeji TaxID=47721 RepID=A0A9P3PLE7_LYOSH|nr:hypothetical protein LshimejAT787_0411340 [Lyophyllum shimeji]